MIIFIYGEDTHRSASRLKTLRDKYIEKYGDTNLTIFEEDFDIHRLKEAANALPFLAEKRMTIIKNILKVKNKTLLEDFFEIIKNIPEETILIIYEEGVPDQRTAVFKSLKKEKCEVYEKLQGGGLTKWIEETAAEKGGKISLKSAEKLVSYVGDDLKDLENEIKKLVSYTKEEITDADIDLLVTAKTNANIFDLVDALGERNQKKAFSNLISLLKNGENEIYILTMIARQVKNLLIVKELSAKYNKLDIAKRAGLHPYVVQKTLSQSRNFEITKLKDFYSKVADTDVKMKTGEEEPRLALTLLIENVCTK